MRAVVAEERADEIADADPGEAGRRRFARCSGLASHARTIELAEPSRPLPQARFSPVNVPLTSNRTMRRTERAVLEELRHEHVA